MITGYDLAGAPGPAVVEQDEVPDEIEQPILCQHTVEERFGVEASVVLLRVALPRDEVFPVARDRAVAGCIAIAHDEKGVVVEGVGDAVLGEVVGQVVVEAGADVPVYGLQFDEDQRQAVDEAHQIRATVVVRHAHALDLQFAHGEKAVVGGAPEVDNLRPCVARFARSIAPLDRYTNADEAIELAVVLDERAGEIDARQLLDGLLAPGPGCPGSGARAPRAGRPPARCPAPTRDRACRSPRRSPPCRRRRSPSRAPSPDGRQRSAGPAGLRC
jgi:hypothetical protein